MVTERTTSDTTAPPVENEAWDDEAWDDEAWDNEA
jgi:hypothetical protein